jgi:hypothetical protein
MSTFNFKGDITGSNHNFGDHGVQHGSTSGAAADVHTLLNELTRILQSDRDRIANADGIDEQVRLVRAELAAPVPDKSRLNALGSGIVALAAGVGSLADVVNKILQAVHLM